MVLVYLPLFTYMTGWFLGQMLVNIVYMEHMGNISLVGGLEHLDFSIYWEFHPIWLSYFQRGRYTTNQWCGIKMDKELEDPA